MQVSSDLHDGRKQLLCRSFNLLDIVNGHKRNYFDQLSLIGLSESTNRLSNDNLWHKHNECAAVFWSVLIRPLDKPDVKYQGEGQAKNLLQDPMDDKIPMSFFQLAQAI